MATRTQTQTSTTPFDSLLDRAVGLTRALDEMQRDAGRGSGGAVGGGGMQRLWLPAVDTYETEQAFVVEADLPGVAQDAIDLHFEQGTLTISGRRESAIPAAGGKEGEESRKRTRVFTSERLTGAFVRSIRLPEYVDGERIEATYANGVLTVNIPKAQGARARKIAVRAAGGGGDERRIEG